LTALPAGGGKNWLGEANPVETSDRLPMRAARSAEVPQALKFR